MSKLEKAQSEVDYWYAVSQMYMDDASQKENLDYAKERLAEAIRCRDELKEVI